MRAALSILATAGLVFGCGGQPSPADGGPDAGAADAGPEPLVDPPACPTPGDAAVDALPLARLRAEGTATTVLRWTREARDGIANVRDDATDDGWATGARGGLAWLDFGPRVGRPLTVRAVELDFEGAAPPVEVRLRDACGGGLVARAPLVEGRATLGDACGSCLELRVEGAARLLSLRVRSADPGLPEIALAPAPGAPAAVNPDSGVVEGFYGEPWTWDERARMIDALARAGLGLYVYAPKDDPRHRDAWREPWDEAFVARFTELAGFAEARGGRAVLALSPFVDFEEGAGDTDRVVAKLRPFVRAGAPGIALFADDIEYETDRPIDGALGALHARVVNEVAAALREETPSLAVYFVGTVYSDERLARWPEAPAYLEALRALDPSVRVLWTGTETFSPSLAAADLTTVGATLERAPAIWDNYWANDAGDAVFGRIPLMPYRGRAPDLREASAGILQNPLVQGALSRLAVGTFTVWAGVEAGEPPPDEGALRAGAARLEAAFASGASADREADAALLERLIATWDVDAEGAPADRALAEVLGRVVAALEAGRAPDGADWRAAADRLAQLRVLSSALHHSGVAEDLVDELAFPMAKVRAGAALGLAALERLGALRGGEDPAAEAEALAAARDALPEVSRFRWMDAPLERLGAAAAGATVPPDGARPALGEPPPTCTVGEALRWRPFDAAGALAIHGLRGATVEGDAVAWTPPHPGTFQAAAVLEGAIPRTRTVSLVCRPAR